MDGNRRWAKANGANTQQGHQAGAANIEPLLGWCEEAGVEVVEYDRFNTGGSGGAAYVSFDNVQVGRLIGQGFKDCVTAWNVASPKVFTVDGEPRR